jgi:hypothetical protein
MAMKAQQLNATLRNHQLDRQAKRDLYAAQMKAAEDAAWSESMSSSLTSLFDNAGAIGKESAERDLATAANLLKAGQIDAAQKLYQKHLGADFVLTSTPREKKHGGKIRTKKKGYTI